MMSTTFRILKLIIISLLKDSNQSIFKLHPQALLVLFYSLSTTVCTDMKTHFSHQYDKYFEWAFLSKQLKTD